MRNDTLENILSTEEVEKIIEMYQQNISLRKISEKTGRGRAAISKMLERLGIKTVYGNHYKYNSLDENFFEKIDNDKKAYWLGLLYADGCIITPKYGEQEIKLALAIKDEQTIIDFKEDLKSTYPIRYDNSKHNKNPKHQIQAIQSLRSQKIVNDLKAKGCYERKSLTLNFPNEEQVPNELIYSFIRGYFDGDGSISCYNGNYCINFVGTEDFIKKLYQTIKVGSVFKDKRKENSWYLTINGNLQVLDFCSLMYKDAKRYMKRKYDKYIILLNKYSESQGTIK